jgi:hypothetical protein
MGGMNWNMTGNGTLTKPNIGSMGAQFDMQNKQAFEALQRAQAGCAAGDGYACQQAQQLQQRIGMQQGQQMGQLQGMMGRGQGGTMGAGHYGRGGRGGYGRTDPNSYAGNIIGSIFGFGGGGMGAGGMG